MSQAYLAADDPSELFVTEHFARAGAQTGVDRALRLDTTVMLVDDPVKRVDNMTMAWGLEGRVPFLDHELVELAATCPPELKTAHEGKGVLKQAARQVIPSDVIDRPKGYFPVPALTHLEGPYLDLVRDALLRAGGQGARAVPPRGRRRGCSPTRTASSPRCAATSCGRSRCSSCGCRSTESPGRPRERCRRAGGPGR